MCRSAVNNGSCSPWVMCSCSVVRGNQIRDTYMCVVLTKQDFLPLSKSLFFSLVGHTIYEDTFDTKF